MSLGILPQPLLDEAARREAERATLCCFETAARAYKTGAPSADLSLMTLHGLLADFTPDRAVYSADSLRGAQERAGEVHTPVRMRVTGYRECTSESLRGWSQFQSLVEVHFNRSWIRDNSVVSELARLRQLQALSLTRITAVNDFSAFQDHPSLKRVDLRGTEVCSSPASFEAIASLPKLEELDIGSMQFVRGTLVCLSAGCLRLRVLKVDGSNVGNNGVRYLSDIESLENLDLRECGLISDASPLANLRQLKELRMANNVSLLSQPTFKAIGTLPQLEYLDLSVCTALTDLSGLASCPKLERLNLRGTKLDDNSLDEFVAQHAAQGAAASAASATGTDVGFGGYGGSLRTVYVTQCPGIAARRGELTARLAPIELRFGASDTRQT